MRGWIVMLALACGCADPRAVVGGRVCATPGACETIHPAGIADPASPDFHGNLIVQRGWQLSQCSECHGADFAGGKSGRSCLKCHEGGPTACTTCHALPPATGAHKAHASVLTTTSAGAGSYACSECHVVPTAWDQPGHIFDQQGNVLPKATVTFGALAHTGGALPQWDGASCSATYCHGDATPSWSGGSADAACGSCHGIPPANHANTKCGQCHGRVADDGAHIVDRSLHADGRVSLGDDSGTCRSCHPSPGGAHVAHLTAPHRIAAPIACETCHRVPTAVTDPGHIDHPLPVVFPNGPAQWDATTETCSATYCHGDTKPSWSGPAAVCGSCHGVPPSDAAHAPTMHLQDCAACHARSIDATGQLLPPPLGHHLDGVVDAP
jgi:predicted CxxxxCH...CXXCH cytochrome family protein